LLALSNLFKQFWDLAGHSIKLGHGLSRAEVSSVCEVDFQMMFVLRFGAAIAAFGVSAVHADPAAAQGFFQSLFGNYSKPAPVRRLPPPSSYGNGGYSPYWGGTYSHQPLPRPRTSRLRAVCVRTCDGFYWPMTNRAKRSQLYDLSKACSNSCNGGARLFYMAANSTNTAGMVDMQGRPYAALENAFVYRKTYIRGCQCKPAPWAFSERARHRSYARAEEQKDINDDFAQTEISDGHRTIVESLDGETDVAGHPAMVKAATSDTATEQPHGAQAAALPATEQHDQHQSKRKTAVRKAAGSYRSPRVTRRKKPKPAFGLFGGGQAKYVWPGDRRR
jgi:Protein of unknown function (DUF2865)